MVDVRIVFATTWDYPGGGFYFNRVIKVAKNTEVDFMRSKKRLAACAVLAAFTTASLTAHQALGQGQASVGTMEGQTAGQNALQQLPVGVPVGQPALGGQGPILAPPISFVDINTGRFGKLDIDMEDGQFLEGAAKHLHLTAKNLDLNEGILKSLDISIDGGVFQDFTIDNLTLSTAGDLNFDTGILLNHKVLRFATPAQAQVMASISQDSLNRFINSPRTLEKLSMTASKPGGMLQNLLGNIQGGFGFSLVSGDIKLVKSNRVNMNVETRVGIGQMGLPIPVTIDAKLGLKDGWLELSDTQVSTNGQTLSPEISKILVNKVNGLSNWGKRSEDIQFSFTDIKVVPGNKFILRGTAEVRQLRFSRVGK